MSGGGAPELVPVLDRHRFDEAALARHLRKHLPGFDGPLEVRQFQGGQSNPTYRLDSPSGAYVLRRKPPGKLLPGADLRNAYTPSFSLIGAESLVVNQGVKRLFNRHRPVHDAERPHDLRLH